MNVYADVDVSEQEDEGAESVSGSDVEQSPWYNADAIAIAVSDLANVNRIEPVWNSIEAIVACSEEEWQVKREKWTGHLKVQAEFTRYKIPSKIYGSSAERAEVLEVGNKYVKSMSVWHGLKAMVDLSIMIVDLLAFCDLDLFGAEHYGGVTKCVQKIMRKSIVWGNRRNLVYISH